MKKVIALVVILVGIVSFAIVNTVRATAGVGPAGFAPAIQHLINTGHSSFILNEAHNFGWHANCIEVPNFRYVIDVVQCYIRQK